MCFNRQWKGRYVAHTLTWYSISIVRFFIVVWKKHSDFPAGSINVSSLSWLCPKQHTEPKQQPNTSVNTSGRHWVLSSHRKSFMTDVFLQHYTIWLQPSSSHLPSAKELCHAVIGWRTRGRQRHGPIIGRRVANSLQSRRQGYSAKLEVVSILYTEYFDSFVITF